MAAYESRRSYETTCGSGKAAAFITTLKIIKAIFSKSRKFAFPYIGRVLKYVSTSISKASGEKTDKRTHNPHQPGRSAAPLLPEASSHPRFRTHVLHFVDGNQNQVASSSKKAREGMASVSQ